MAAAAGSVGGKDLWRIAGVDFIAVWFPAKLQWSSIHAKASLNRAEIVRSVTVSYVTVGLYNVYGQCQTALPPVSHHVVHRCAGELMEC